MADNNPEALHVIDVPLAFYEWLATVEKDVRVHDLTPHEIAGLQTALRAPAVSEEAVEALKAADYALHSARAFILEKHGSLNPCREEAIAKVQAAIATLSPTTPTEEPQS